MKGMFNKEEKEETVTSAAAVSGPADTVIGSTVKVEGNLECNDTILIDGKFVGTIKTSKHITIGVDAEVEGNLEAEAVYLSGLVRGNITATDTIELSSSARLYGDLDTETLSVEKGALVQGQCTTGTKETVSQTHTTVTSSDTSVSEATPAMQ